MPQATRPVRNLPPSAAGNGAILILAAGASSRMGGVDKLLLTLDGMAQLRRIALAALATGWPVLVALPPADPLRRAALAGLQVTVVPVPDQAEGIAATLRAGARAAAGATALMILPADLPELEAPDLAALIAAHAAEPGAIHRGAAAGVGGHPVILPADLLPALVDLHGDRGARDLIAAEAGRLRLLELPGRRAVLDLDTPEEWAAWLSARADSAGTGRAVAQDRAALADPLAAALARPTEAVLAVLTAVEGTGYRRPGSMMCLFADGSMAGGLTNGCIEGDLAIHARKALRARRVTRLRYGAGSPFFDIRLPCGGGIEVTLFPASDPLALAEIAHLRAARHPFALRFASDGALSVIAPRATGPEGGDFIVNLPPPPRFIICGTGPEAMILARLVAAAGLDGCLVGAARAEGRQADAAVAQVEAADARTAVVIFLHEHDLEPPVLRAALAGPAFYIGALGSRRTAAARRERLRGMGFDEAAIARVHGPIGLVHPSHDPATLAASVLAQVLSLAEAATGCDR